MPEAIDISRSPRPRSTGSRRRAAAVVALAVTLAGTGPLAQEAWPHRMQRQMARVSEIGWRLADAAGALCHDRAAPIGAQLDSLRAYAPADRPHAAATLGLGEAPWVSSVVPGSPAALAGLRPGDEVIAVNGQDWQALAAGLDDPALVADATHALIAAVPPEQPLVLTIRRDGGLIALSANRQHRCAVRFVLKTGGGLEAHSDSANVAVSDKLVDFAGNDDELALVLAHELAHVLYRDSRKLPLRARRQAEARADVAGALLARCAGYDIGRGLAVFLRLGKRDWLDWLGSPTHGGMAGRAKRLAALAASEAPANCPVTSLPATAGGSEIDRFGLASPAAHASQARQMTAPHGTRA